MATKKKKITTTKKKRGRPAKKPIGRPTKYNSTYCKKLIEFFDVDSMKIILETFYYKNGDEKEKEVEVANELPLISEFEHKNNLGIGRCSKWAKAANTDGSYKYPEFRQAYKLAKKLQEGMLVKNALKGLYNPTFSIFAAKNMFKWRDKHDLELGVKLEEILAALPDDFRDGVRKILAKKVSG